LTILRAATQVPSATDGLWTVLLLPSDSNVAKSNTQDLTLYTGLPKVVEPQLQDFQSVPVVFDAFAAATGWSLSYSPLEACSGPVWSAPVDTGEGSPLGHVTLKSGPRKSPVADSPIPDSPVGDIADGDALPHGRPKMEVHAARRMATAVAAMCGEMMQMRRALWQREAELAAGVPLLPREDDEEHLAERLESVLRDGAKAIDCEAAALYMLDDSTSELRLRTAYNLPFQRYLETPRRLQGAVADLEALLGHTVVIEDTAATSHWKVPEGFPAAVCVPVATPASLLGTLWIFANEPREFLEQQVNILKVVAGRLASELEREMLMRVGVDGAELMKQVGKAERLQQHQLPSVSPILDGWELAGWTSQAQGVGGDFYDWFTLPEGGIGLSVGDALASGLPAAMTANTVKAALRSHGQYQDDAADVLQKTNLTLWTSSAGDQFAKTFFALIDTLRGRVNLAAAGLESVLALRHDGWESLAEPSLPLGEGPETLYESCDCVLRPGETLLVSTNGVRNAIDRGGKPLGNVGLADPLSHLLGLSAKEMLSAAQDIVQHHSTGTEPDDRTILVVKRTH